MKSVDVQRLQDGQAIMRLQSRANQFEAISSFIASHASMSIVMRRLLSHIRNYNDNEGTLTEMLELLSKKIETDFRETFGHEMIPQAVDEETEERKLREGFHRLWDQK